MAHRSQPYERIIYDQPPPNMALLERVERPIEPFFGVRYGHATYVPLARVLQNGLLNAYARRA